MTKVAATSMTADFTGLAPGGPALGPAPEPPKAAEAIAEFRLVIEEESKGSFIYKTLDRRTGEVVNQFPREEVLRLKEASGYSPGRVFNSQS